MPKKFATVKERRAYWREWYGRNKHRAEYKAYNKTTKQRLRKDSRNFLKEYKKTLKCLKCGIADYRVLDFHHTDPNEKDHEVANLANRRASIKRIVAEIEKCICLCANCHRIHHWEEKYEDQENTTKENF